MWSLDADGGGSVVGLRVGSRSGQSQFGTNGCLPGRLLDMLLKSDHCWSIDDK